VIGEHVSKGLVEVNHQLLGPWIREGWMNYLELIRTFSHFCEWHPRRLFKSPIFIPSPAKHHVTRQVFQRYQPNGSIIGVADPD
jgi:hypothetical protein